MKNRTLATLRPIAVAKAGGLALAATAIIHSIEAPEAFHEQTYKGVLFLLNALGALLAALAIKRSQTSSFGWSMGYAMSAGAALGYVLSRTLGMPMLPAAEESFWDPLGIASLLSELGFVALFHLETIQSNMATLSRRSYGATENAKTAAIHNVGP